MAPANHSLEYYLSLQYSFSVLSDPDGGFVVSFPDLPGCLTQIDDLSELVEAADAARIAWIEAEFSLGRAIPAPTYANDEDFSGKLLLRMPKVLHRDLARQAKREGVSLNHYVNYLLGKHHVERTQSRDYVRESQWPRTAV